MADLSVNVCGVDFKNPIIPASGVFGYGREYEELFPLNKLGGIATKGTTRYQRTGNIAPRIAETPAGMLNSVGLQNPGIDHFVETDLPYLLTKDLVVLANIAGSTPEECAETAAKLEGTGAHMIELNISCPNVKQGGAAFGTSCTSAEAVTAAVRKATSKPLVVKLSPNVTSIVEIAKAVESAGADALSMINTLLGMRIDVRTRRPVLHNNVGGLSGPAILPVAVRMIWQTANAVSIPIIGMGGISRAEDAVEMTQEESMELMDNQDLEADAFAAEFVGKDTYICKEEDLSNIRWTEGVLGASGRLATVSHYRNEHDWFHDKYTRYLSALETYTHDANGNLLGVVERYDSGDGGELEYEDSYVYAWENGNPKYIDYGEGEKYNFSFREEEYVWPGVNIYYDLDATDFYGDVHITGLDGRKWANLLDKVYAINPETNEESYMKILLGPQKKSKVRTEKDNKLCAYHAKV